jgi:hypothetical protein
LGSDDVTLFFRRTELSPKILFLFTERIFGILVNKFDLVVEVAVFEKGKKFYVQNFSLCGKPIKT